MILPRQSHQSYSLWCDTRGDDWKNFSCLNEFVVHAYCQSRCQYLFDVVTRNFWFANVCDRLRAVPINCFRRLDQPDVKLGSDLCDEIEFEAVKCQPRRCTVSCDMKCGLAWAI